VPVAKKNPEGDYGIAVEGQGMASASQPFPLQIEIWDKKSDTYTPLRGAYRSFKSQKGKWIGRGVVKGAHGLSFAFEDEWTLDGSTLRLNRSVKVSGDFDGGFRSSATFEFTTPTKWPEVEWFSP